MVRRRVSMAGKRVTTTHERDKGDHTECSHLDKVNIVLVDAFVFIAQVIFHCSIVIEPERS